MKQHITPEEIKKDLAPKQQKQLASWYYSKEWSASTPDVWLSIGQMIEFLTTGDHGILLFCTDETDNGEHGFQVLIADEIDHTKKPKFNSNNNELCDVLWEACVEVLEKE